MLSKSDINATQKVTYKTCSKTTSYTEHILNKYYTIKKVLILKYYSSIILKLSFKIQIYKKTYYEIFPTYNLTYVLKHQKQDFYPQKKPEKKLTDPNQFLNINE